MGEKPGEMRSDQIKRSIDVERSDLEGNIQQLEHKVKTAMDWRAQFQKNPMTMIGLAFGGGVLLSTVIGGRHPSRVGRRRWEYGTTGETDYRDASGQEHNRSQGTTYQKQKALDIWDSIKGAVIGVAASRFRSFLDETIPGFAEQYRKTEQEKPGREDTRPRQSEPNVYERAGSTPLA